MSTIYIVQKILEAYLSTSLFLFSPSSAALWPAAFERLNGYLRY